MTLNNVAKDSRLEVVQMSVFVSSDDNANELRDIEGASVGYLESDNAADQVMSVIDGTVATEVQYKAYNRNLLGGLYRENPVKSRNYEAVKSSKKWENVGNSYIIPALLLYRYSYI